MAFPLRAGDIGLNGLYGLVSSNRVPSQIIERIELLKGPGALINGIAPSGSVGGAINIVTKRAGEIPFTRVTPFFMSAGNYGLHLENSGRYGENKEWGVRFNGAGAQRRSFDQRRQLADRSRRAGGRLSRRALSLDARCHFTE